MKTINTVTIEWLEKEFNLCNHKKYHKYCQEWISNLTENQIEGFEKQRISQIDKSKINVN